MTDLLAEFCDGFDLDIALRDASCDPDRLPVHRAIAALCIGMDVDDAFYSVRELREAVTLVLNDAVGGREKFVRILANRCDDFQRALYYVLAGRGVVAMLEALDWLSGLLVARGRVAGSLSRRRIPPPSRYNRPMSARNPMGRSWRETSSFRLGGPGWWSGVPTRVSMAES
jgi:hypothetical protein